MHLFNNFARTSVALAVLAVSAAASAGQITQTFTKTASLADWADAYNPSISRFDTNLGTLTSVSLTFKWTGKIDGTVTNKDNDAADFDITHTLKLDIGNVAGTQNYYTLNLASSSFKGTLAGLATGSYDAADVKDGVSYDITNAGLLSLFTGTGNFDVSFYAYASTQQSGSGDFDTSVNTIAGVEGTLVYNYQNAPSTSPVPAPPAFAAMGIGALRLVRRRKAAKTIR
jgi:hypothetical protein